MKVFLEYREVEKINALITDQNQRTRKDTPLVVEVSNERTNSDRKSPER